MATKALIADPVAEEAVESLFAVPGIHCVSCIAKIEEGLPRQPGIISARVNMGAKRRSEEHTSELQSLMRISYAVFCLKKTKDNITNTQNHDKTSSVTTS